MLWVNETSMPIYQDSRFILPTDNLCESVFSGKACSLGLSPSNFALHFWQSNVLLHHIITILMSRIFLHVLRQVILGNESRYTRAAESHLYHLHRIEWMLRFPPLRFIWDLSAFESDVYCAQDKGNNFPLLNEKRIYWSVFSGIIYFELFMELDFLKLVLSRIIQFLEIENRTIYSIQFSFEKY